MKHVFLIVIAIYSTLFVFSQNNTLENILFAKINAYRAENGLTEIIWDSSIYKMATHHAKYLSIVNSTIQKKKMLNHQENIDIPDFDEYLDVDDRARKYIGEKYLSFTENCVIVNPMYSRYLDKGEKKPDEEIVQELFNALLNSEAGYEIIIKKKDITLGACSVQCYDYELIYLCDDGITRVFKLKDAVAVLNAH